MRFILFILIISTQIAMAQVSGNWQENGQFKLRINADGQLANYNKGASSEFISGSNNHFFKFINLWISGYDASNQLYISTNNGFSYKSDFSQGPIDSLTFLGADPKDWNKVWAVTKSETSNHIKNFKNNGYIIPENIKNWPANGKDRFNKYLAPFIDFDRDGYYDPSQGDYPDIKGDVSNYFIVNDAYSEHKASGGQPLVVEIYGMVYSLNAIPNVFFIKYFIVNRTGKSFSNVKVSFHTAFELGNDKDNFCGTHVGNQTVFAYNADENDDNHFGTSKPVAALMLLNKKLASSLYITNDTDTSTGMPGNIPEHNRFLMEGKWKSSKPLSYGGNGTAGSDMADFIYPGSTDPKHSTQQWTEMGLGGQRSILANLDINKLAAKGFIELDVAVLGYEKSEGNPFDFIASKTNEISTLWNKTNRISGKQTQACAPPLPNPVARNQELFQDWFVNYEKISVCDQMGRVFNSINPNVEKTLRIEKTGIYYISFYADNQIITKKILIF